MPAGKPVLLHYWSPRGKDQYLYFSSKSAAQAALKTLKKHGLVRVTHKGHQTASVIHGATRCAVCNKVIVSGKQPYTYLKKKIGAGKNVHSLAHTRCADAKGLEHFASL